MMPGFALTGQRYTAVSLKPLDDVRSRELVANLLNEADIPMQVSALNKLGFAAAITLGNLEDAQKYLSEAEQLARSVNDLGGLKELYPLLCLTEAELRLARGQQQEALELFERTEELALGMTLRPLIWQAQAGAARALGQLGRHDAAEQHRQRAQATINEIASLFEDEELRQIYIQSAGKRIEIDSE